MSDQSFGNHAKYVPLFHYFMLPLGLLVVIGVFVNLFGSIDSPELYSASLVAAISILVLLGLIFMRGFALKAQDRAIRAEENFRHYVLTETVSSLVYSRIATRMY